jgi:hypothetical protein
MPKVSTDYSKTIIYKLCCLDHKISDIYIGHTTNFTKRKNRHKNTCTNANDKCYDLPVYKCIREHGGWDNWDMILIEQCACEGSLDALKKEREYLEQLKASFKDFFK